ncbi:putative CRISPR-associated protein [Cyanobacterium aponinum AL20118]|uniref:CRISPR-associated protein n=1 Tax=Cyanobacterium aponinum AL20115 TaxID=3090662 RepID=A0AAF0Z816_9CHRO|nr:putative CRISPR-associated protein [Cyanobacterium aponinum]WPF87123.1 putative CRISPR-associated protein [Cyanobacterium aponinum AL20115]
METIIMTVGTSLRTNKDDTLPPEKKRPWHNKPKSLDQSLIDNIESAIAWMKATDLELISAETKTFYHLNLREKDEIILLYSATKSGEECAKILKLFFTELGQEDVTIKQIPEVNYEIDVNGSILEKMANLLAELIKNAKGNVTLAATGGFKAQSMIMALSGNIYQVPVCYIHEQYKSLIYLPFLSSDGKVSYGNYKAELPHSTRDRKDIFNLQEGKKHHRPKTWKKAEKILSQIPWIEKVYYDENAFSAPYNGIKKSNYKTKDICHTIWLHLYEDQNNRIGVSIETTGYNEKHLEEAMRELRERLGHLF